MDNGHATMLTAPEPDLEALSFALPEPESVGEWISRLPMANVTDTAGQIRQATFEIARLDTDWATRMSLLEGIRPTVLYLTARLDKAANSAGSQSDAISRLAQRLQTNLCSGYRAVALAALGTATESGDARNALSLAVHRSLTDLSRTLLRALQYYVAPADRLWLKLNQLYYLAEQLGMHDEVHTDTENTTTVELSITRAYLRSLLLAMARPYQLRHRQLADVFRALSGWVHAASLAKEGGCDLHMIDLASDQGPRYVKTFEAGNARRAIRTDTLVAELDAFLEDQDSSLVVPPGFDAALVSHLAGAWGKMKPRAYGRSAATSPVKVCVGMRATHYYLSGGMAFGDQLRQRAESAPAEINPFLKDQVHFLPNAGETRDVWAEAFDVGGKIPENPNIQDPEAVLFAQEPQEQTSAEESHSYYDTTTVDTSPGGYRLRWNEPFPSHLQTGELVGLRDETDPRWCLAVARWLRQDEEGPFMGVELLAPQARPIAVRLVQTKGGQSDYQRAFLLPELKPIGRPATLITPASPFQPGQKVHLLDGGTQSTAQLGDSLLKTESFNQFTFRVLDGYLDKTGSLTNMEHSKNLKNKLTGFR